jgi:mycothiol synthase
VNQLSPYTWRPIDAGQVPAWSRLLVAIQVADELDDVLTSEDDITEELDDPACDYSRGSVAVYDGEIMIGYGVLGGRSAADPVHVMHLEGGVHPSYRGRGVGTRLLAWAEQAATPLHQERHRGHPLSIEGRCPARNTAAVALFAEHGYQPARWFHFMTCDLSAALPPCPEPAGVQIVSFTPDRSDDAHLIRNEAFRDHWGSAETTAEDWEHFIGYHAFRPAFSLLAYDGSEPLGVLIGHEYDSYTQATGRRELYIAVVATRQAARKRGIASALLVRALTLARDDGALAASLHVDADSPTGAFGLYQRAGFTIADTTITQVKPVS